MNAIISFFLGLAVLMSGDEIGSLFGTEYVALVCNVIGVCLMGYGVKIYADGRKEYMRYKEDMQEILDGISTKMVTACEFDAVMKGITAKLADFSSENGEKLREICSSLVAAIQEVQRLNEKNEGAINSVKETLDRISKEEGERLEKVSGEEEKRLEKLTGCISNLDKLPQALLETMDELAEKIDGYTVNIENSIRDLIQDLADGDKKRTSGFKTMIQDMADCIEESNEDVADHIKKLAHQYTEFEEFTEKLIHQMTLMSEKDYEIMKGFLDD